LVDELIEKCQLAKEEKAETVKDIMDTFEKEKKEIQKRIKEMVDEATQKDIDTLTKRVKELEKKLAEK